MSTMPQPRSPLDDGGLAPASDAVRLRALIDHSTDIVALIDAEGRLLEANPAANRVLGWSVEDCIGKDPLELVHPDDRRMVEADLIDVVRTPGPHAEVTYRIATADNDWRYIASSATNLLHDPDVGGILINARDVTAQAHHIESVVETLTRATECRDPYTAGHQRNVARISRHIAIELDLAASEVERITLGAELHDLGKIAVPTEILSKPSKLSPEEFALVKRHTIIGAEILHGTTIAGPVADIVRHHHEHLDGSGYPDGLTAPDIPIGTRIVAVADVVDAVVSHRPYRPALGIDVALEIINAGRGHHYDDDVVSALVSLVASSAPQHAGIF
jgi:PAS domain S-box-containing protein